MYKQNEIRLEISSFINDVKKTVSYIVQNKFKDSVLQKKIDLIKHDADQLMGIFDKGKYQLADADKLRTLEQQFKIIKPLLLIYSTFVVVNNTKKSKECIQNFIKNRDKLFINPMEIIPKTKKSKIKQNKVRIHETGSELGNDLDIEREEIFGQFCDIISDLLLFLKGDLKDKIVFGPITIIEGESISFGDGKFVIRDESSYEKMRKEYVTRKFEKKKEKQGKISHDTKDKYLKKYIKDNLPTQFNTCIKMLYAHSKCHNNHNNFNRRNLISFYNNFAKQFDFGHIRFSSLIKKRTFDVYMSYTRNVIEWLDMKGIVINI